MIWLIGNRGMLGYDVEMLLSTRKFHYIGTDIEIDITNFNKLKEFVSKKEIEWIINCAAYTAVDKAESEKQKAFLINGESVKNIALIAKEKNAVLIHISTDYIFDGKNSIPYNEEDKPNPLSVYGKSKLKGEEYVKEILEKYFIIRTSWLYGKNGKNFVYTMLKLFKERKEIKVVNDQFGAPTYTKDLANVIIKIIEENFCKYGIYHFTNEGSTTWYEFAKTIYRIAKEKGIITKNVKILPIRTEEYPTLALRPKFSVLSKEKIKKNLSITIRDWSEALKDFILNEA